MADMTTYLNKFLRRRDFFKRNWYSKLRAHHALHWSGQLQLHSLLAYQWSGLHVLERRINLSHELTNSRLLWNFWMKTSWCLGWLSSLLILGFTHTRDSLHLRSTRRRASNETLPVSRIVITLLLVPPLETASAKWRKTSLYALL